MVAWFIPALISAATAVGSNIMHQKAAGKVAKEQRFRELLEQTRQDEMRGRAQQSFSNLLAKHNKEAQQADQKAETAKLQDAYAKNVDRDSFLELLPGQGDASGTVQADVVNEGNRGIKKALKSGAARAALESYGRVGLNNDIGFQDANMRLNDISRESRASADILPLELQAAQNKGASLRGWANLLSTVSSIAGSAASGNMFKTAMTPGPFGGESALMTIGDKVVTPSFNVFKGGPALGVYGPSIQKSSFSQLLGGR